MGDTGYTGPVGATGPRGRQPFGSGALIQGVYGLQTNQVSMSNLANTVVQPKMIRVVLTGSTPTGTYVNNLDGTTGYTSKTISGLDQGNPINTYDDPLNFLIGDMNIPDPNNPVLLTLDYVPAGTYLIRGFSSPPITSSVRQNFTTLRWQGGGPTGSEGSDLILGTLAAGNGTSFVHYYGTLTTTNAFEGFQYTDARDNFDWGSNASNVAARMNFIRLTSPNASEIASNLGPTGYSPTGTGALFSTGSSNAPTSAPSNLYFVVSPDPGHPFPSTDMAAISFDDIPYSSYYIYNLYYNSSLINTATGSSSSYNWNISNGFQPTSSPPAVSDTYYATLQPYGGPYAGKGTNKNPTWTTNTVTIDGNTTSWGATGYVGGGGGPPM